MAPILSRPQYVNDHDIDLSSWDVMKWKYVPRYCAGNSPVTGEFPHKGQWRGALMFSFICALINGWVNNREAGDLRRHRYHYDVTVMLVRSNRLAHDMTEHAETWTEWKILHRRSFQKEFLKVVLHILIILSVKFVTKRPTDNMSAFGSRNGVNKWWPMSLMYTCIAKFQYGPNAVTYHHKYVNKATRYTITIPDINNVNIHAWFLNYKSNLPRDCNSCARWRNDMETLSAYI